jgi:AraC-like DNA-binding protein
MLPATPVLDYAGFRGERGYDAWLEGVCRSFCRIDAEPTVEDRIDWKINVTRLASLSHAQVGGTSARFSRTRDLLSDSCDDFVLTTAISGDVLVVMNGEPVLLRESQMCLMDMSTVGGVCLHDGNRFTSTRIPRAELLGVCPNAERWRSRVIPGQQQIRELIVRYFALSAPVAASLDEVGQRVVAGHMIDLVALLLRDDQDEARLAAQRGYSAARLRLVQQQVLENLDDSSLSVGSIARNCGLSAKQVQRLFERAGTTFTEFVLEQRLLLARRLLSSPGNRHDKIGTIAYRVGFGDLSYFNRAFHGRFDMTPSECRNGQPADA